MRNKSLSFLGVLVTGFFSSFAIAAAWPTTAPVERSSPRVEVFPFTAVSGTNPGDWTGRGIQEQLQSDVSRTGASLVISPQGLPAGDDMTSAKQNHADLAVTGSYQVVGDQIRANGHLIEVATNNTVGGFSATGSQHDLFKIEDALGEQLRALLPRPISAAEIQQAFEQPPLPAVSQEYQAASPTYIQPAPVTNYYYDAAPVDNYYPDYGYGYDYPYVLGFYGGVGYGHFGHDRGGRYYNHGFEDRPGFSGTSGFRSSAVRGGVGGGGVHVGGFSGGHVGGFSGGHVGGGFGGGHGGGGHR